MERSGQIFRFTVPGALFVLTGVGVYAFARLMWHGHLSHIHSLSTITTSIAAIAASIPIGFLGYQIYYWRYSPFFLRKYVTRDKGREALIGLQPEVLAGLRTLFDARLDVRRHHESVETWLGRKLMLLRLNKELMRSRYKDERLREVNDDGEVEDDGVFEQDERKIKRIYKDNWYENWDVFRALLELVATKGERPEIKENFQQLYDIYHTLGACRLAVPLGTAGACLYLLGTHRSEIHANLTRSIVGLVIVILVTVLLAYVLHQTRNATWKSAIHKVRLDLRSCFETNRELHELVAESGYGNFKPRMELRDSSNARFREYRRPLMRQMVRRPVLLFLGGIGTIDWVRRPQAYGRLDWWERRRFRLAARITILAEMPRLLIARVLRRADGPDPSRIQIPETPRAEAVREACGELDEMLRHHSYRAYIFGRSLAKTEGKDKECDEENLFAATMLYHYGLRDLARLNNGCFTVASAKFAEGVLKPAGFSEEAQGEVLDAIARQLNPVVDPSHGAVQRYAHAGILFDMFGIRAKELDPEGVARVFENYAREGFTVKVLAMLKQHAEISTQARARQLFAAGFGRCLELSPWRKVERLERLSKVAGTRQAGSS